MFDLPPPPESFGEATVIGHTSPPLRYWLFAGHHYYANAGICDLVGRYASVNDAIESLANLRGRDWFQVVDVSHDNPRVIRHGGMTGGYSATHDENGRVKYTIPQCEEDIYPFPPTSQGTLSTDPPPRNA